MSHRTFNVLLAVVGIYTAAVLYALPADVVSDYGLTDAQLTARAELRRELAEARMCINEYGAGVAVVRTASGQTVCVPRGGK